MHGDLGVVGLHAHIAKRDNHLLIIKFRLPACIVYGSSY